MIATIKPINSQFSIVEIGAQDRTIETNQAPQMAAALRDSGLSVEITLKSGGFRIGSDVEAELLEMAGLSSFQAAKATASGKIAI